MVRNYSSFWSDKFFPFQNWERIQTKIPSQFQTIQTLPCQAWYLNLELTLIISLKSYIFQMELGTALSGLPKKFSHWLLWEQTVDFVKTRQFLAHYSWLDDAQKGYADMPLCVPCVPFSLFGIRDWHLFPRKNLHKFPSIQCFTFDSWVM